MDKVRRIVHPKLRPFHFQIKGYYLSDEIYPTDNPSLVWIRPMWEQQQKKICLWKMSRSSHEGNLVVIHHLNEADRQIDSLLK